MAIFSYTLAFDAPVREVPVGIPFDTEKLEWGDYPMVKKILFFIHVYNHSSSVHRNANACRSLDPVGRPF